MKGAWAKVLLAAGLAAAGLAVAGCGSSDPGPGSSAAIAGWTEGDEPNERPSTRTIGDGPRATSTAGPSRTIGGSSRDQRVVRRGALVDARFVDAPLADAMRLLAETAGVDVVIEEGVRGTISVDLRDVQPLEAMRAIAEAHGATLELTGRTAIVRSAR